MKTFANDNRVAGGTLSYVKYVEIIHPDVALTDIPRALFPAIFLTPIRSSETYETTLRKIISLQVKAYLVMQYNQRELSIIGDSTRPQGKGILDLVEDFLTVFRGTRLSVGGSLYLDKPMEISNVDYIIDQPQDNVFMLVAELTLDCSRLLLQTSLPGDI